MGQEDSRPSGDLAPDGPPAEELPTASLGRPPVAPLAPAVAAGATTGPAGVPGYEVLGELGRGGMGVVYKARQAGLNRLVALKMILHGGYASAEERRRFRAEAEAVARLQHPNIVQIYEVGEHQGHPYYSLELCPGGSLAARLDGTPWQPREAARLVETLARAMQAAHDKGVVHRDLKPANVLLAEDGAPKVSDFGLAKRLGEAGQTASGAVLGTPSYMAPEQAGGRSRQVGPAADVYALGAVLYELLTGRPPFRAATAVDTLLQVVSEEPVPVRRLQPKVPRDLETVCLKCLEKPPGRRYASARALAQDLRRFGAGEPVAARPTGPLGRAAKWARRRPAVAGLLLLLVAAVVVAFVLITGERDDALRLAKEKAELAESNFQLAQQKGALAEQEKKARVQAELQTYVNQVARAQRALQDNDINQALTVLEACQPDLHGWEHRYLLRRCRLRGRSFLLGYSGGVVSACFSPDGRRLAAACNDGVRVWDAATGAEALAIKKTGWVSGWVSSVSFSPDGRRLAGSCADGVRVWDAATGAEALTIKGQRDRIEEKVGSVCFSPDGRRLAGACGDRTVRLWDAATGAEALVIRGQGGGPVSAYSLRFSPDGGRLAGACRGGTVRVWDAATGAEALTIRGDPLAERDSVCFSPDGRRLAGGCKDEVRVWDAASGAEALALKGHDSAHSVCFSPDGTRLASGSLGGEVRVSDTASGAEVLALKGQGAVESVCFSPDGRRLAVVSRDLKERHTVRLWDAVSRAEPLTLRGHASPGKVCFSPDGRRLAAAFGTFKGDGTVRIWDTATGAEAGTIKVKPEVKGQEAPFSVCFSPDGRRLAGICDYKTVRVWDAATGAEALTVGPLAPPSAFYSVCFSPDGRRLAVGFREGGVRVWDAATGAEVLALKGHDSGSSVCFSPDGRRLAGLDSGSGVVCVWDAATGAEALTIPGPGGRLVSVHCVCFSPDGRRLAGAGQSGVRVWDAATAAEALERTSEKCSG